jgi:hypothetical protein
MARLKCWHSPKVGSLVDATPGVSIEPSQYIRRLIGRSLPAGVVSDTTTRTLQAQFDVKYGTDQCDEVQTRRRDREEAKRSRNASRSSSVLVYP